jgi:hypothetical protein
MEPLVRVQDWSGLQSALDTPVAASMTRGMLARASDREAEAIGLHAEGRFAGMRLRAPERSRAPAKS